MAGQLTFLTIPAGDWLQAGAAFFGVAFTIGATIWLEHWLRGAGERESRRRLNEVIHRLDASARALSRQAPIDSTRYDQYARLVTLMQDLKIAIDLYSFVRESASIKDLDYFTALRKVDFAADHQGPILVDALDKMIRFGHDDIPFQVNRQKGINVALAFEALLADAMELATR